MVWSGRVSWCRGSNIMVGSNGRVLWRQCFIQEVARKSVVVFCCPKRCLNIQLRICNVKECEKW